MKTVYLFLAAFIFCNSSFAGFELSPTLGTYKYDVDVNGAKANQTFSLLELRTGYTFESNNFFIGGFYGIGSDRFVDGTDSYYMGPLFGYISPKGFYTFIGYSLFAEQDLKSGGIKYTSGTGPHITLGHKFAMNDTISVAPEITWRRMEFDDVETQGTPATSNREDVSVFPSIALWFKF